MKTIIKSRAFSFGAELALVSALAGTLFAPSAHANVYATNIKINGSLTNATAFQGSGVTISYILNEAATAGTTINIISGANVVRTITIAAGSAGTLQGLNTVTWDGKATGGTNVTLGTYGISITAAANGFTTWTQTSIDSNPGNYVFSPQGLAVDVNSNSPYYGRVFVGNAKTGPNPTTVPGDKDGILKLNADGSFADEGQSTGGYTWVDDGYDDSPHYLRYGQDDRIYALDWTGPGVIIACDMIMSTNQIVLPVANYANNSYYLAGMTYGWGMMDVTDAGTTNGRLWLGDNDFPSAGVWVWRMTNGVADPNDAVGTQVIQTGGDLTLLPSGDFMMDESSNIFVSQYRSGTAQPDPRTMVFTNWDGVNPLVTGTAWSVGQNDDTMRDVFDTALDKRANPTYVACPMGGGSGGIRLLYATNGMVVTVGTNQVLTNLDAGNFYWGASWDAVGNLYGASSSLHALRVYSPPGANQATTLAVETVQVVTAPTRPTISNIALSGVSVVINFTGAASDPASVFTLQSAASVAGPYTNVGSATISQISPGVFQATTTANGSAGFYRIKR